MSVKVLPPPVEKASVRVGKLVCLMQVSSHADELLYGPFGHTRIVSVVHSERQMEGAVSLVDVIPQHLLSV